MPWKGTGSSSRRTKRLTRTSWRRVITLVWSTSSLFSGKWDYLLRDPFCYWLKSYSPAPCPANQGSAPAARFNLSGWCSVKFNFHLMFQAAGRQSFKKVPSRHDQSYGLDMLRFTLRGPVVLKIFARCSIKLSFSYQPLSIDQEGGTVQCQMPKISCFLPSTLLCSMQSINMKPSDIQRQ